MLKLNTSWTFFQRCLPPSLFPLLMNFYKCPGVNVVNSSDPVFLPANLIWKSKVPPKINILGWLVAHGRVNTCDLLQRRRPKACFSPHWCVLCKKQGESVDHVFVLCEVVSQLWERLFQKASLIWETPSGSCEFLSVT